MVSHREAMATFGGLTVCVAAILAAFVYPGFLTTHCTPNIQVLALGGTRTYCSDGIVVDSPGVNAPCVHGSINGTVVKSFFVNASFSLHTFVGCGPPGGPANFNLNVTVVESTGLISYGHLPLYYSLPHPGMVFNWTTPDGSAGIQWNCTGQGLPQPVLLLVLA